MTTTENIKAIDLENETVKAYKGLLRQKIEELLPDIMKEEGKEFENEEAKEYFINNWVEQAFKKVSQQGKVSIKYKGGSNNYE